MKNYSAKHRSKTTIYKKYKLKGSKADKRKKIKH